MVKVSCFTYGLAGGSSSSSGSTLTSLAQLKPTDDGIFPFLESFPSWPPEAARFLPWQASPLGSPLSTSSADTRYGVGINIRVSRVDAGSSGRGAGLQINTAFFFQSCRDGLLSILSKDVGIKGVEYLPKCPDDCSRGQHLRWCPAIALAPRNIISTFLHA